jgi:hypothetical protein
MAFRSASLTFSEVMYLLGAVSGLLPNMKLGIHMTIYKRSGKNILVDYTDLYVKVTIVSETIFIVIKLVIGQDTQISASHA